MNSNKYTLDRFEKDYAVFLKYPDETENLLIRCTELHDPIQEGDIVHISIIGDNYKIEPFKEETANQKEKVRQLLEKLKNNRA